MLSAGLGERALLDQLPDQLLDNEGADLADVARRPGDWFVLSWDVQARHRMVWEYTGIRRSAKGVAADG